MDENIIDVANYELLSFVFLFEVYYIYVCKFQIDHNFIKGFKVCLTTQNNVYFVAKKSGKLFIQNVSLNFETKNYFWVLIVGSTYSYSSMLIHV